MVGSSGQRFGEPPQHSACHILCDIVIHLFLEAGKMAEQLRMLGAFSEVGSSSPCRTHMQVSVSRTIQHSSSHGIRIKDFKKKSKPSLDIELSGP